MNRAELARTVDELERHGLYDMAPAWGVLEALEFCDGANRALDTLMARLTTVKGCLASEGAATPSPGRHDGSGHRGPGGDGATPRRRACGVKTRSHPCRRSSY